MLIKARNQWSSIGERSIDANYEGENRVIRLSTTFTAERERNEILADDSIGRRVLSARSRGQVQCIWQDELSTPVR